MTTISNSVRANVSAILRVSAAAALLAAADAAQAQAALEEVVVTAQRREQSLQDVGVSVTALGEEQIRDLGITNVMDIGRVAPGVVFASTGSGSNSSTLSMRGIAQSDFSPIQEAPNSLYLDDIYASSTGIASFGMFDLERIEVLRGPQGTLFGRNSTGGLASFITAKPTPDFTGYAEAGVGRYNQYWLEAAVSGPLSDRVRVRLSVRREQADGWWKNYAPGGKDAMETDSLAVRGQLEFDVTDSFLARLSMTYGDRPRTRVGTYKSTNFYIDANGAPAPQPANLDAFGTGPGNNIFGYRDTIADNHGGAFDNYGRTNSGVKSPSLLLQWSAGSTTFTSLTNWSAFDVTYREETDGSPIEFTAANQNQSLRQWSQEFRGNGAFGANSWTAGVYFLDIDNTVYADFFFPALSGSDFAFDDYQDMKQRTRSLAAYGQMEWTLSDTLRLTTGLRYTRDRKRFDTQVYFRELGNGYSGGTGTTVFPPPGLLVYDFRPGTVGSLAKQSDGLISGKVQLDYKPDANTLLYAGISRGVKGAGFNANLGGALTNEETPFKSESVTTYEVGGKFDRLDRRLRINSSVYYYDYSNYQGFAFNGTQGLVGNYKAKFYGTDFEVQASLPGDVTASVGGSYSHTNIADVPSAYFGVRDERAVLAPKWVINGSARKSMVVGPGKLAGLWSFDYLSNRYSSIDNNAATYVRSSIIHNLRLTYTLDKSGIEFAAFVNNVADADRQAFVYDGISFGGYTISLYDKPRTWGASVRKFF